MFIRYLGTLQGLSGVNSCLQLGALLILLEYMLQIYRKKISNLFLLSITQ